MALDDCLQSADYEIINELQVRKQLEARTGWRHEFTKGSKYGYDLELYRWNDTPDSPSDRHLFGHVEIERAEGWRTGSIPDDWHYYSFLRRKIHQYRGPGVWGDTKPNSGQAVYLKFNRDLDNCFVAAISAIDEYATETKRSDGTRTNTYLKIPFGNPLVRVGVDDAVSYILDYLGDGSDKGTSPRPENPADLTAWVSTGGDEA